MQHLDQSDRGRVSLSGRAVRWMGRLLVRAVLATVLLGVIVALFGGGYYLWVNWAAARERDHAEADFAVLERLEIFQVPIEGTGGSWSRTWPDRYEIDLLSSDEPSARTDLHRRWSGVDAAPDLLTARYVRALEREDWDDITVTCTALASSGRVHVSIGAHTQFDGERAVAWILIEEGWNDVSVSVSVAMHDEGDPRRGEPCPFAA